MVHGGSHSLASSPPIQIHLKSHSHCLLDVNGQIQPHDLAIQMLRNVTVWLTNHWFRGKQGMDIEVREDWSAFLKLSSSPQQWDKALDLEPFLCPQ